MNSIRPRRIAVIGGGISGLAAAHWLIELSNADAPLAVTLYEASPRWGGAFGTETIDGYRLELGADMFITDKPWALDLCRRLELSDQLISPDPKYRKSLILSRGRPVPTPDAFQLMVPGKWGPILTTSLLSPLGKLRLLLEPLIPAPAAATRPDDESLASFVRRRLGREALDRLVQPLVGGIYTGDPEQLSIEATLPRFRRMEQECGSLAAGLLRQRRRQGEKTTTDDGVSGARYGLFVSLRDGMGALPAALARRLSLAADVRLSQAVQRLESLPSGSEFRYRIVTANESAEYDGVILSLAAYRAADLMAPSQPELAARLREIEYASTVVVVTGHRRDEIAHSLDAYGLVVPQREQRRLLAVSFLSRKFPQRAPEGREILRTFVGGALQPELARLDDEALRHLVRDELREILGVRGDPEVCRIVRYPRGMPQYHVGHLSRVAKIEELTARATGLELCGAAYHGVGLPDCIHDGESAAERMLRAASTATPDSVAHADSTMPTNLFSLPQT